MANGSPGCQCTYRRFGPESASFRVCHDLRPSVAWAGIPPLEQLMTRLTRARHENRLERTLQQLVYTKVLVLDELGNLPLSREEAGLNHPGCLGGLMV